MPLSTDPETNVGRPAFPPNESQRRTAEVCSYIGQVPQLSMHLHGDGQGMHIIAYMWWEDEYGREVSETIATAVWRPLEVTPVKVVEWGHRALAAWLAKRLQAD